MCRYRFVGQNRFLFLSKVDYHIPFQIRSNIKFFCFGFRIEHSSDAWTTRFEGFKQGVQKDVQGMKRLLSHFNWKHEDIKPVGIFSAIPSDQSMILPKHHIYETANHLAEIADCPYYHNAIKRIKKEKLHYQPNSNARDQVANGMYAAVQIPNLPNNARVIIFDDLITRGSTIVEISKLILAVNPTARIFGLGVAKCERETYGKLLSENGELNEAISAENERCWNGLS